MFAALYSHRHPQSIGSAVGQLYGSGRHARALVIVSYTARVHSVTVLSRQEKEHKLTK